MEIGYLGAALAGLLAFFTPCILPMVPFYLCYLGGLSMAELREGGGITPGAQRRLTGAALAFALGVTTIFLLLGLSATALGRAFADYRPALGWLAAAVLLVLGLHLLGWPRLPFLDREARIGGTPRPAPGPAGALSAYGIGLAFGFGWTPCVGPALAAILLVAAQSDDLARGVTLLLTFGLAMTLPFVLAALFTRPFMTLLARHRGAVRHVERAMGLMLILFALLIATGSIDTIAYWLLAAFDWSGTLR